MVALGSPVWGSRSAGGVPPMRYEKAEIVLRVALDMQGSAYGLTLHDIQHNYAEEPLSRRTAERLRDAVERLFPQMELANPGDVPKRWRMPGGTVNGFASITAEEVADLKTAVSVLRRENMHSQAVSAEKVLAKLRALMARQTALKIEPDLEALTEAEGLAMRPGPKPKINREHLRVLARGDHHTTKSASALSLSRLSQAWLSDGPPVRVPVWQAPLSCSLERARRGQGLSQLCALEHRTGRAARRDVCPQTRLLNHKICGAVLWRLPREARRRRLEVHTESCRRRERVSVSSKSRDRAPERRLLVVRFRAGGLLEMAWHLFTWGSEVEIIKPKRLASLLREQSEAGVAHLTQAAR